MAHLHLHFLLLALLLPSAYCANSIGSYCNQDKTISPRAPIQANIKAVLAALLAGVSPNGFIQAVRGPVFGMLQCRGDLSMDECTACGADAVKQIQDLCPNTRDSRIWFDYCFLRYDTENFFGKLDTGYTFAFANVQSVSDPEEFEKKLGEVMGKARQQALVTGNNALGRAEAEFSPLVTIHGMAECTRDLPAFLCAKCLSIAISNLPRCCDGSEGGQVHFSSCTARFEIYTFYYPVDSVPGKRKLRPFNVFDRNSSRFVEYMYHP